MMVLLKAMWADTVYQPLLFVVGFGCIGTVWLLVLEIIDSFLFKEFLLWASKKFLTFK